MKKILTLCMVCKDDHILLAMKNQGLGVGRWNGFGGKVEEGESIEEAAIREVKEEVAIDVTELIKMGVLEFSFQDNPKVLEVHIFRVDEFEGEPVESDEMQKPQWFHFDTIPYSQMWSDDEFWLPLLIGRKKFEGKFLFDRPSDAEYSAKIIESELKEI